MKKRAAFSLVELLVVVAVIGLLLALVLPALSGTGEVARLILCTNNLKRISEAEGLFRADGMPKGLTLTADLWTTRLLPYMGDENAMLVCPNDPVMPSSLVGQGGTLACAIDWDVGNIDRMDDGVTTILYFEGASARKISQEQFDYAMNDHPPGKVDNDRGDGIFPWYFGWSSRDRPNPYDDGHNLDGQNTGYQPGSNPGVYWILFEDWWVGTHGDNSDARVKVEHLGDGSIRMTAYRMPWASHRPWIVSHDGESDPENLFGPNTGPPLTQGGMGTPNGPVTVFEHSSDATSYGMNTKIVDLWKAPDSAKIMAIDYEKHTAAPEDDWTTWPHAKTPGIPSFARHASKVNTLFFNGSVRLMPPGSINPVQMTVREKSWLP